MESYLENSNFLADINNERAVKNKTYVENMKKLERFVMYVFKDDVTVVPKQSAWFGEFNKTSEEETLLKDRAMYKEDWLGLRFLDETDRLEFREIEGPHMSLTEETLREAYEKYFSPKESGERMANGRTMEL